MKRRITGQPKRTLSLRDVPAPEAAASHYVTHSLHGDVDEALFVFVRHLRPLAGVLHLFRGTAGPAVEVQDKREGPGVGGKVFEREVEVETPLKVALAGVIEGHGEEGVVTGLGLVRERAATASTGDGGGEGEETEEEHGYHRHSHSNCVVSYLSGARDISAPRTSKQLVNTTSLP